MNSLLNSLIRPAAWGLILAVGLLGGCDNAEKPIEKTVREYTDSDMKYALQETSNLLKLEEIVAAGFCRINCAVHIVSILKNGRVAQNLKHRQLDIILNANPELGILRDQMPWEYKNVPQSIQLSALDYIGENQYEIIRLLLEKGVFSGAAVTRNLEMIVDDYGFLGQMNRPTALTDGQTLELLVLASAKGATFTNDTQSKGHILHYDAIANGKFKTFEWLIQQNKTTDNRDLGFAYSSFVERFGDWRDGDLVMLRRIKALGANLGARRSELNAPEWAVYAKEKNRAVIVKRFAQMGVKVDHRRIAAENKEVADYEDQQKRECRAMREKWEQAVVKGVLTGHVPEREDVAVPSYCSRYN